MLSLDTHGLLLWCHIAKFSPPFLRLQGNWPVFGLVVKLIKNVVKHDGPCTTVLAAGGETVKLLLGVARLVSRMPEQRKLLKVRPGLYRGELM